MILRYNCKKKKRKKTFVKIFKKSLITKILKKKFWAKKKVLSALKKLILLEVDKSKSSKFMKLKFIKFDITLCV